MAEKKNVVVVGGGYGGTLVARALSEKLDSARFNLLLINDRPFYVHLPAMARVAVSDMDQLGDKALFGYDQIFVNGNGSTKVGRVVSVEEGAPGKGGEVVLENVASATKDWPADGADDLRRLRLANVNAFLRSFGLDASQIQL